MIVPSHKLPNVNVKRTTPEAERSSGGAGNDGFRTDSQILGGRGIDRGLVKAGPTWTGKLKDVAFEGIAKIGDKLDSYHKEVGKIGGKLGGYKKEADVMLLKDDGMKGSGVGESVVS